MLGDSLYGRDSSHGVERGEARNCCIGRAGQCSLEIFPNCAQKSQTNPPCFARARAHTLDVLPPPKKTVNAYPSKRVFCNKVRFSGLGVSKKIKIQSYSFTSPVFVSVCPFCH